MAFGVRQDLTGGEALASYRSLYLHHSRPRLHLNTFRGVRAISKFDWPFTPTLSSSVSFSWFRVCLRRLDNALFGLAFASDTGIIALNLAGDGNS